MQEREIFETLYEDQLFKFIESSYDRAFLLTAIARLPVRSEANDYASMFGGMKIFKVIELMHEFCFFVRKSIEMASVHAPEFAAQARSLKTEMAGETIEYIRESHDHGYHEDIAQAVLCNKDYAWIVNRIVHSRDTMVFKVKRDTKKMFSSDELFGSKGFLNLGHSYSASSDGLDEYCSRIFGFVSDYDGDDQEYHFIDICDFVGTYMTELIEDLSSYVSYWMHPDSHFPEM